LLPDDTFNAESAIITLKQHRTNYLLDPQ
jgi:hypothetical protein